MIKLNISSIWKCKSESELSRVMTFIKVISFLLSVLSSFVTPVSTCFSRWMTSLFKIRLIKAVWLATMVFRLLPSSKSLSIFLLIISRSFAARVPKRVLLIDPIASTSPHLLLR